MIARLSLLLALPGVAADDAKVLKDIYNSLSGPSWPMNSWPDKWNLDDPSSMCSWHNITCNAEGRVTRLDLSNMAEVAGTLPSTIVDLSALESLKLKRNPHLSGTIPEKIGKLTNLKTLVIGRDRLSGTIPFGIYALQNLEEIYLKQNFMSGTLSEALGNLKKLSKLEIRESKFYGLLPKALSGLARLRVLNIEDNAWRGFLPPPPGGLEECHLSDMKFTTTYEERVATPIKTGYGESNAQFFCPLPAYVPPACRESLYCTTEPSMAEAMHDCAVLYDMYLGMGGPNWESADGNDIKWSRGEDPASCCDWEGVVCRSLDKRVKKLDLRGIKGMTGYLPPSIGDLGKLETLLMKNTLISGTLPEEIGLLSKLKDLEIGRDKVSGTIPFSVYGLQNLEEIYLKQNLMSGTISEAIGALKNLRQLDLRESKFTGSLPGGISNLGKLEVFNVEDNAWRGFLPNLPATLDECDLTDKTFSTPYDDDKRGTVPRGRDWDDADSKFNCPLPNKLPKACHSSAFCVTDPLPDGSTPYAAAPSSSNKGFTSGLTIGILGMFVVMIVLCTAAYCLRKTLMRIVVTEAKQIGRAHV